MEERRSHILEPSAPFPQPFPDCDQLDPKVDMDLQLSYCQGEKNGQVATLARYQRFQITLPVLKSELQIYLMTPSFLGKVQSEKIHALPYGETCGLTSRCRKMHVVLLGYSQWKNEKRTCKSLEF